MTTLLVQYENMILLQLKEDYEMLVKEGEDAGKILFEFDDAKTKKIIKYLFKLGIREPDYVKSPKEMGQELLVTWDAIWIEGSLVEKTMQYAAKLANLERKDNYKR